MEELFKPEHDVFEEKLKRRKGGGFWRKIGISLLVLGVVGVILVKTKVGRYVPGPAHSVIENVNASVDPDRIFEDNRSEYVNILLIGRDVNYRQVYQHGVNMNHQVVPNDRARSDSMILISLNRQGKCIRMVSLPRDAIVHMPPNDFHVREAKLNAAHAYGGPELLRQTISEELGITTHYYAVIKFEGFKNVIDRVGGVDVDVDGALKRHDGKSYRGDLNYDDNWGNLHIHIKKGPQHMDGQTAHNYVRFRMDLEGDPGRIRRQQQVMRALAKKLMHTNPVTAYQTVVELKKQFETDMPDAMIASAAAFAKSIGDAGKIQPITLFGVFARKGSLTLNRPLNEAMLRVIFGPTFNPNGFLPRSPSTEGDEIGATNDVNPATLEVLREAGLTRTESGGWRRMHIADRQPGDVNTGGATEIAPQTTGVPSGLSTNAASVDVSATPSDGSLSVSEQPEAPILQPTSRGPSVDISAAEEPTTRPRRRSRRSRHRSDLSVDDSRSSSSHSDDETPVRHSD